MSKEIAKANADAVSTLEQIQEDAVTERAQELAPDMLRVLEKIARGHKLPGDQRAKPSEMKAAATEIIDRAQGRPGTRKGEVNPGEGGGLTVIINAPPVPGGEKTIEGTVVTEKQLSTGGNEPAIKIQEALHAPTPEPKAR